MKVQLKYFASIRESLGLPGETWQTQGTTVGQLRDELIARGGPYAQALARGRAVRVALDQTMSDEQAALRENCELAFFPPVTGG